MEGWNSKLNNRNKPNEAKRQLWCAAVFVIRNIHISVRISTDLTESETIANQILNIWRLEFTRDLYSTQVGYENPLLGTQTELFRSAAKDWSLHKVGLFATQRASTSTVNEVSNENEWKSRHVLNLESRKECYRTISSPWMAPRFPTPSCIYWTPRRKRKTRIQPVF